MTTVIGPIDIEELRPLFFDFSGELKPGETLATVTAIEVTTQAGTDPTPANLLNGSPVISGAMVEQMIKPVITGVSYHFRAVAMTNLGSQLVVAGNLRVVTF